MKEGDLVRFKHSYEMYQNNTWDIGILIEYQKWEKSRQYFSTGSFGVLEQLTFRKLAKQMVYNGEKNDNT